MPRIMGTYMQFLEFLRNLGGFACEYEFSAYSASVGDVSHQQGAGARNVFTQNPSGLSSQMTYLPARCLCADTAEFVVTFPTSKVQEPAKTSGGSMFADIFKSAIENVRNAEDVVAKAEYQLADSMSP